MGNLIKRVVVKQLQMFLDDTESLHPFQLGFRTHYRTELILVTLQDDLLCESDRVSVTLSVLLDLPAAFQYHR